MIIKNIIVINGQEYDFEDLSPEKRREIVNALNERALGQLNYIKEKTA